MADITTYRNLIGGELRAAASVRWRKTIQQWQQPGESHHRQLAADVGSRHREISRQFLLISTPLMGVPELR